MASFTMRILRSIHEVSFGTNVGSRTCLPALLPSPTSASLAVMWGLSGGTSLRYQQVVLYFLPSAPQYPLSSVTLSLSL